MSSILTNNSAMVALQTLKSINNNLGKVQSEISTGKTVESAKDNAAVWAISKVMSSDVEGFKAISDSLALGQATVGVAMNGAETITDLLTEIKGKIVNSQEENVDRAKIQTDIEALTKQITAITGAAQFNGLNLLNGSKEGGIDILSSLDRSSTGAVATGEISVGTTNLTSTDATITGAATAGGANGGVAAAAVAADSTVAEAIVLGDGTTLVSAGASLEGVAFTLGFTAVAGEYASSGDFDLSAATGTATDIAYVASEGDTAADIAAGLEAAFVGFAMDNGLDLNADNALRVEATSTGLSVTTQGTGNTVSFTVGTNATTGNVAGGQLNNLSKVDVSTSTGASNALAAIEGLIQTSIDTAAELGSSAKQIDTQSEFVGKLSDLLTSGIGALVDADMEAASAKLQALQTQQQLGVQALSIANQAPQTILSLFR